MVGRAGVLPNPLENTLDWHPLVTGREREPHATRPESEPAEFEPFIFNVGGNAVTSSQDVWTCREQVMRFTS